MSGKPVEDHEHVWRRVNRNDVNASGAPPPRAFRPRPTDHGKLSVNVRLLTTYNESILDANLWCLFELKVSNVISLGLSCIHDPIDATNTLPANQAHAYIASWGTEAEMNAKAAKLAFQASLVQPPTS